MTQRALFTSSIYINRIMFVCLFVCVFVCLFVCLSVRSLTTFQQNVLSTCGFLQMNLTLKRKTRILVRTLYDVIKGVNFDIKVMSSEQKKVDFWAKNWVLGQKSLI